MVIWTPAEKPRLKPALKRVGVVVKRYKPKATGCMPNLLRTSPLRQQILNRRNYGASDPAWYSNAVPITRKTPFGNPFEIGKHGDRAEVIEKFRHYFYHRIKTDEQFKKDVLQLRGKHLLCWCAPLPCHGEVIREWLEQREWNLQQRRLVRDRHA